MKTVKAWAVAWRSTGLISCHDGRPKVFSTREAARWYLDQIDPTCERHVVRVEIREIKPKRKEKRT